MFYRSECVLTRRRSRCRRNAVELVMVYLPLVLVLGYLLASLTYLDTISVTSPAVLTLDRHDT